MSMLDDYKELKKIRLADGKKALDHYATANAPGIRVMGDDATAKARIAAMKQLRDQQS